MFPVGEVAFDEVPETWTSVTNDGWSDMAIALGQADGTLVKSPQTWGFGSRSSKGWSSSQSQS